MGGDTLGLFLGYFVQELGLERIEFGIHLLVLLYA